MSLITLKLHVGNIELNASIMINIMKCIHSLKHVILGKSPVEGFCTNNNLTVNKVNSET